MNNFATIQKKENKALNDAIASFNPREQYNACVALNQKGQEEGWYPSESPCRISTTRLEEKSSTFYKSEFCCHSQEINLNTSKIELKDIEFYKELIQKEDVWHTPHARRDVVSALDKLIQRPKEMLLFEKTEARSIELSIDNLGVYETPLHTYYSSCDYLYKFVEAPKGFSELRQFAFEGLLNGILSEGSTYSTVRHGTVRSGKENEFNFNLKIDDKVYQINLYGSDRKGSAERPCYYGKDMTVTFIDSEKHHFALLSEGRSHHLILENLASNLGASYTFK
jgi:hypothetical protein